jgi:hypothetical protein
VAGVVVVVLEGARHDLGGDQVPGPAGPGRPVLEGGNGVRDGLAVGAAQLGGVGLRPGGRQQRERFGRGEDQVPTVAPAQARSRRQRPAPRRLPQEHVLEPGPIDHPGQPEGLGAVAQPKGVRRGTLPIGHTRRGRRVDDQHDLKCYKKHETL